VDTSGRVLGVVFATSASDSTQAYALTDDEISKDVAQGRNSNATVETSQFPCAA
jgi:hypothetical protein